MNIDNTTNTIIDELIVNNLSTGVLHSNSGGVVTSSLVVNGDVDPAAAIVDTKLATISTADKVSNSATTATNSNTASTIVLRHTDRSIATGQLNISLDNATTMATPQISILGLTDANKQLGLGYNTTSNFGYIQSIHNLTAYTPLVLQPSGGIVSIGSSATILPGDPTVLQVIESSPASGTYGGRIVSGGVGSGDVLFMAGLYNDGGTKKVLMGGHNNGLTAWADMYTQGAANLFINESSGTTVIGSNVVSTGEKLKVHGTMRATSTIIGDADTTLTGNLKIGAGTQTGAGTLNYTANRFTINNNAVVYALPNPANWGGTNQVSILSQEIVITRTAGNFALSSSSTTQGFTAASVSSNTPLEITVNYSVGTAAVFGSIHVLFTTNTAVCYEGHFKNSIPGSNVTNIVKLYSAGAAVSTASFADGDSFRITVLIAGY